MRVLSVCAARLLLVGPLTTQVTTAQYDPARTGATVHETTLAPANVTPRTFGKLFAMPVGGDVYAQPLYLPRVRTAGGGWHAVVYVATEHDDVYAFDAEQSGPPLWHVTLAGKGGRPVEPRDVHCPLIRTAIGITATPVIDPERAALYVVARSKEPDSAGAWRFVQRLHALNIESGAEMLGGPVEITASASGIAFDPIVENPRAAMLLAGGKVVIAWGGSCDSGPYHGWVMAYDAATLAHLAAFTTTPGAMLGGVWQGDAGPAADGDGNVFVLTGNGVFDASEGGADYGDAVLRLRVDNGRFTVADYFSPADQRQRDSLDLDLGSSGPVLLPGQPGTHLRLLVFGTKGPGAYLIDRDRMRAEVQRLPRIAWCFGAPAYWNAHVYFACAGDVVKDYRLDAGGLSPEPRAKGRAALRHPGATPAVSANGARNGIVWVVEAPDIVGPPGPAVLHAYDAEDVSRELYNSEMNAGRDRAGPGLRFSMPTVARGRVYVGTGGEVNVYGRLSANR